MEKTGNSQANEFCGIRTRLILKPDRKRRRIVALIGLLAIGSGLFDWLAIATGTSSALAKPAASNRTSPTGSLPRPRVTLEGRKSIDRGIEWLVSAIRRNGSVGVDVGAPPDLGCTAITGLALLSQGNTPTAGPHSQELNQILGYLLNTVEKMPDGSIPVENKTLVQMKIGRHAPTFLMALFFSQVYGEAGEEEPAVKRALERLVVAIGANQQKDGTWGNESWAPVLGTVLGWESLRGSASVGLDVQGSAKLAGDALLKKMQERNDVEVLSWMFNFYKETASLRALYSLGYYDDPSFQECVRRVLLLPTSEPRLFSEAGGEEFLAFYLISECMLKQREDSWASWYPVVSEKIMHIQNRDGSWSGHHCITARTFCTAAALLTLQAPNRCLPSSDF
jgi:hypothetical protein